MYGILIRNGSASVKSSPFFKWVNFYKYTFVKCLCTQKAVSVDSTELRQAKYHPKDCESRWYDWWESKNYFKPSKSEKDSFVILLPPPNITGSLHLGHVLTATIQDVILRWKRMKGESVWWIPGVDHAGIATQAAVEKYLNQTGLSRQSLGKELFVKKVWEWKKNKEAIITQQFRNIGASLDWSQLTFTMDPNHSQFVTDSFIKLFNQGLIYRAEGLVNWSCALKTTISDIEINWVDVERRTKFNVPGYTTPVDFGTLYEFAYKVCDEDDEIIISTTRPETMLGDVAVAVHPDSPAHSRFRGKHVWHPFRNVKIPIIFDDFVDMSVGSGAVKITPCHSLVDFNVGLKHGLEKIEVINEQGLINNIGSVNKFHGLKRFDARNAIIKELKNLGLFRGYKEHAMKVPICSRSGDVVELVSKKQWFLNCKEMAKKAMAAVKNGQLELKPQKFDAVWCEWLIDLQDWNLSRQLWWGHQIPMYECKRGGEVVWVGARTPEEARQKATETFNAAPDEVVQDPDVLDTWFSSGLLPLNMYKGEVNQTKKPPVSLMVTAHDILFFWVARMVMLSLQLTGELPFNQVFLHSIVCDPTGKKMSKSIGNVINPEDVINGVTSGEMSARLEESLQAGIFTKKDLKEAVNSQKELYTKGIPECGADALRLSLCSRNVMDEFINFELDKCLANKHFGNKLWQALNYFIKITENDVLQGDFHILDLKPEEEGLNCFDRWILSRLAATTECVDKSIAQYKFYLATQAIKLFFMEEFCDVYLESSKSVLKESSPLRHHTTVSVFFSCLETTLRMLSPFMPFLAETLYQDLPPFNGFNKFESVTITSFPDETSWSQFRDEELDGRFQEMSKLLTVLRKTRNSFSLTEKRANALIKCSDGLGSLLFGECRKVFGDLARMEIGERVDGCDRPNVITTKVSEECIVFIEHYYDKETLKSLLSRSINEEDAKKNTLEKLSKISSTEAWNQMSASAKARHLRRITKLEEELEEIEQFKETIERCDR